MKNTFGNSVSLTLFGESHGEMIGAVLDGIAPGIEVSEENIRKRLDLRRSLSALSTARREADDFRIVSGVFNGKTTGTPLCILIPNENTKSSDYDKIKDLARPGHADYSARMKYHGFEDARGGGHFSGRLTAPIVAIGSILLDALEKKGILIGTHIARLGDFADDDFSDYESEIKALQNKEFATLSDEKGELMKKEILSAKEGGDSVGGILETVIFGMPGGVGEPFFDTVEGELSHALFGIPGVKGVQFGAGFDLCFERGSVFGDPFTVKNGQVITPTNYNGGVNGGITNGMPITIRLAVKPTPSISKEQDTVDMKTGENAKIVIGGRHDPAIIHRARIVSDAVTALVVCDLLAGRFGTDYLSDGEC